VLLAVFQRDGWQESGWLIGPQLVTGPGRALTAAVRANSTVQAGRRSRLSLGPPVRDLGFLLRCIRDQSDKTRNS
jgi:hypothetical protein